MPRRTGLVDATHQSGAVHLSGRFIGHVAAGAVIVVIAGCGHGSGGAPASSKANWSAKHQAAVTAVRMELDLSLTALDRGDRQAILGSCGLLRDDVAQARTGLPVPDPATDAALRTGLDAVSTGVGDCIRGAQLASVASITEQAMRELATAKAKMDLADQAIAAWR